MLTFIETRLFSRIVGDYLDDDEYALLQAWLGLHPHAGAVIPGSGGLRKVRWGIDSRGKRGGVRIIYYLRLRSDEIWMVTIYAKNEAAGISVQALRRIREEIDG